MRFFWSLRQTNKAVRVSSRRIGRREKMLAANFLEQDNLSISIGKDPEKVGLQAHPLRHFLDF
jgi:hypothetical protein